MNNETTSILVVDDEPEMVRAICELLQKAGYRPMSANSGAQALEIVKQEQAAAKPPAKVQTSAKPAKKGKAARARKAKAKK